MKRTTSSANRRAKQNAKKAIATIKSFDLTRVNDAKLQVAVGDLFRCLEIMQMQISVGQIFYRIVRLRSKEPPTNVSRIRNPPVDLVMEFGRANKPKQSAFYASAHPYSPIQETELQIGDYFAMSTWTTSKVIRSFEIGSTKKSLAGSQLATVPTTEASQIAYNFLSDEFVKQVHAGDEFEYRLSAAVAERVMYEKSGEGSPFGGVTYPSVASSFHRENVVFRPDIVDSHLSLERVIYGRVASISDDRSKIDVVIFYKSESFGDDGEINWMKTAGIREKLVIEPQTVHSMFNR